MCTELHIFARKPSTNPSTAMTINFYLKDSSEATTSIILNLWAKRRLRWAIGETIDPAIWDDIKQTPKRSHHDYMYLVRYLDRCREAAKDYYQSARLNGDAITPQSFKHHMAGLLLAHATPVGRLTFMDYLQKFCEQRKASGAFGAGTVKNYYKLLNRMNEFSRASGMTYDWKDIDLDFFYSLTDFMFNMKGYGLSTAKKYITTLKIVLNCALEDGISVNPAFRSKRFNIKDEPGEKIFLTEEELIRAYQFQFDENQKHLRRVRDQYIVASFTGLRFSDLSVLKAEHVVEMQGGRFIRKMNQKTGRVVFIPLHPIVAALMPRLEHKVIQNQPFNRTLKAAFRVIGFYEDVYVKRSRGGKVYESRRKKYELLTAHTARSNFITNCLIAGIPEKAIMDMAGISNVTTIRRYQRLKPKDSAVIAMNSPFFRRILT